MPDPSTLLLATCIGCSLKNSDPVSISSSCNAQPQHSSPSERQTHIPSPCISKPEAAPTVRWSSGTTRATTSPLLRMGSRGQAVTRVQAALQQSGYQPGVIDGIYGSHTQAAVIRFQQAQGLNPDGIVGAETWASLQKALPELGSNPQTFANSQTSRQTEANPQPAGVNRPPGSSQLPASQSRLSSRIKDTFAFPQEYLWLLGCTAVYVGGWAVILKDVAKEIQGYRTSPTTVKSKDFEAALKRIAVARQGTSSVVPVGAHSSPANSCSKIHGPQMSKTLTSVNLAASLSSSLLAESKAALTNQSLEVIEADGGRTIPLKNLIVEPNYSLPSNQSRQAENNSGNQLVPPRKASSAHFVDQNDNDETLVATLPAVSDNEETCTYSLVEDAAGLFVLRGNELRIINRHLSARESDTSMITVRRTNAKGTFVDKSFKFELKKMQHTVKSTQESIRVALPN